MRVLKAPLALGLLATICGVVNAQGTSAINPHLYDNSTASTQFAARGSLEQETPARANVLILGQSSLIAEESVRPTNPWANIQGEFQSFEFNYNVDSGDMSWTLLGTTLTGNQLLPSGAGLAYMMPSLQIMTDPNRANAMNTAAFAELGVSVNGGPSNPFGGFSVSGNSLYSFAIYFTQYDVHTVSVTGNLMYDVPGGFPVNPVLSHADVAFVSAAPVPEPATLAILGVGGAALLRRRKRNR